MAKKQVVKHDTMKNQLVSDVKKFIDMEIEKDTYLRDILGDIRLDDYAVIEYTFKTKHNDKPYWHKGVYQLTWNLREGLLFNIAALTLEEHPEYGLSQWRMRGNIFIRHLDILSDGTKKLNTEDYGSTVVNLTKVDKAEVFNNTDLAYPFIISSLDKIKKNGNGVSYTLYPWESNKDYDYEKTRQFIKLYL